MDDSMEPASWAPPRTESVTKKETATEPERVGVEWAHVSSDMVIQQGATAG